MGQRDAARSPHQFTQRGYVLDNGEPRPPRLHRGAPGHGAEAIGVPRRLGVVPSHHAVVGLERHYAIDAELGQLLHGQFGPVALGQRERDRDAGHGRVDHDDIVGGFESAVVERAPTPLPGAVADRYRLAVSQAQDAAEVVRVVVAEARRVKVVDENVRRQRREAKRRGIAMTHASIVACKSEAVEPKLSVQTFDDDREDDAPRVVLVHGAMDRGASFSRVVGYLHDYVVTTYDRRGYAHSMDMPVAETLDAHIDDLIGILEATSDGGPSTVIGHSLGGVISLAAAARRHDLVHAVGVYESPMPWLDWWPTSSAGSRTLEVDTDDPGQSAERFMRFLVGDMAWEMLPMKTQEQRRAEGPALLADLRALRIATPPYEPDRLKMPVAIAGGSDSRDHHKQGCEAMATMFHTDVQWVEGAGHGGHMSHPGPFAGFVRKCVGMHA